MDKPVIVCGAGEQYAMGLCVMLKSLLYNIKNNQYPMICIMDGGITRKTWNKIIKSLPEVKVKRIVVDNEMFSKIKPRKGHFNTNIYYRLIIPKILPKKYDKAIYLDSDLIVLQDINKLWKIPFESNYLLAVQEMNKEALYVSSKSGLNVYKELGIQPNQKYLNSGVLVINLKKWREEKISSKIITFIEKYRDRILWYDQDGLNAILAGKWKALDFRWNVLSILFDYSSWKKSQFTKRRYIDLTNNPYIIHFSSEIKPWNKFCIHPYRKQFFRYLDMTAWRGWRPKKDIVTYFKLMVLRVLKILRIK